MKLKTLKDLDLNVNEYSDAEYIIKQESIKWVKERMITSLIGDYTAKKYFMDFFNITEEDLK